MRNKIKDNKTEINNRTWIIKDKEDKKNEEYEYKRNKK